MKKWREGLRPFGESPRKERSERLSEKKTRIDLLYETKAMAMRDGRESKDMSLPPGI